MVQAFLQAYQEQVQFLIKHSHILSFKGSEMCKHPSPTFLDGDPCPDVIDCLFSRGEYSRWPE